MRFSNAFLDEIRDRVPISDVIGQRVTWDRKKTKSARGDWWACCPFHGEKTPSFHCEDRKGRYHCFGCGVSGDHFRFLTDLDGLSFPEAVERVADMAGVPMPVADPDAERRDKHRASLIDVMEMAAAFFKDQLQTSAGAPARAYLRDRGLSGRTIETFRLGYAPAGRSALKAHLAAKGVGKAEIEACGLVVHGPDIAVSYDRFRDRIMFPIPNARERVIAFGGRALSADVPAKYLNSNETELFHKGRVLYNFARARRAAPAAGPALANLIVVEGYMDVIALDQAGLSHAVAPLGTALTEAQLALLWRVTPQPILCFDGDEAGLRAAHRVIDLALPSLAPGRSLAFAIMPQGKDPDDLVREEGRAGFEAILAAARPLADMLWSRETAAGGFDTPERRAALETRLRAVTGAIGEESVRRHYSQDMRERMTAFFGRPAPGPASRLRAAGGGRGPDARRGGAFAASDALRARPVVSDQLMRSKLVRGHAGGPARGEAVLALTVVNHPVLMVEEFDDVSAIAFDDAELRRLWVELMATLTAEEAPDQTALLAHLKAAGFGDLIDRLEAQVRRARDWTATGAAALDDARHGFRQALLLHKRRRALKQEKHALEREMAEAAECGDGTAIERLIRTLAEVQAEETRLANQEAIIDGFGSSSGRTRGLAGGPR